MSETSSSTLRSTTSDRTVDFEVIKRNGTRVPFDGTRIRNAIEKAFRAEISENPDPALENNLAEAVDSVTRAVIAEVQALAQQGQTFPIERVQDFVERKLMDAGHHGVARRYIVYREDRRRARALANSTREKTDFPTEEEKTTYLYVTYEDGSRYPLNIEDIDQKITRACIGFRHLCYPSDLVHDTIQQLYDGVQIKELNSAMILAARSRIEIEPAHNTVAARLLLMEVYEEVFGYLPLESDMRDAHIDNFERYIKKGVIAKRLSPDMLAYDLDQLAAALDPSRDELFGYLGIQTLYDRYLIHDKNIRLETTQYFWMRVAMGLALRETGNREERVIQFYNVLSQFHYVSSTPTLFNSGTMHPQLSSCYLSTISDDLENIFKLISDNASLQKWSGGIGNDWTNIRATGAIINGTNGLTQGVIPFLKVANDTAVAVNQGGKRKGAVCAYLELWHLDVEDFIELRKNTGDERRRTHDMNTALWIPDLFMKRVKDGGVWTLFNPYDTPDLHDSYGMDFERRYRDYENSIQEGKIVQFKTIPALDLWRKMLTMLFETGHPWITFKDPSNIRSPQDHVGVVHSSNLCTEILLNTTVHETAVCNLGSVNLLAHMKGNELDREMLRQTIRTAIRMLDNVIDLNFYPTKESRNSNLRHRPVGLGMMAFQDALQKLRIPYDAPEAIEFADESMELISYYAILSSAELAKERGAYETYRGSKWSKGLLPIDTIELLEKERGGNLTMDRKMRLDWTPVREAVAKYGMRNSNTMAIAPTATIAQIAGISQSIEPTYANLYAKSNLSGEFAVLNPFLVQDLKSLNLWDRDMVDELKYYDGSVQAIDRIPDDIKRLYKTAFEIDPSCLINCASRRQKWIDMGQSLNLYISSPSGKKLSDTYLHAWESGLKTTYYMRTQSATQVEKSTLDVNRRGIQPRWMKSKSASSSIKLERDAPKACSILDPECESCQ